MTADFDIDSIAPEKREDYIRLRVDRLDYGEFLIDGRTPHTLACLSKSLLLAREFAGRFDVDLMNSDGSTSLTMAPSAEFTAYLVSLGAKVSSENPEDCTISLHWAAEAGLTDQLRILLEDSDGNQYLESYNEFGLTPLASAAKAGHIGTVEYLLTQGATERVKEFETDRCVSLVSSWPPAVVLAG